MKNSVNLTEFFIIFIKVVDKMGKLVYNVVRSIGNFIKNGKTSR